MGAPNKIIEPSQDQSERKYSHDDFYKPLSTPWDSPDWEWKAFTEWNIIPYGTDTKASLLLELSDLPLLKEDKKFIEKRLSMMDNRQYSSIINDYVKEWRIASGKENDENKKSNAGRRAGNLFLLSLQPTKKPEIIYAYWPQSDPVSMVENEHNKSAWNIDNY